MSIPGYIVIASRCQAVGQTQECRRRNITCPLGEIPAFHRCYYPIIARFVIRSYHENSIYELFSALIISKEIEIHPLPLPIEASISSGESGAQSFNSSA